MKLSLGIFLIGILLSGILFMGSGCTQTKKRPALKSEEVWKDEIKEIAATGQAFHPPCPDDGVMFFNKNKPRLKTVQLWLESGKAISETITAYVKSIMPDDPDPAISPLSKITGEWYGLDQSHESAIIFTFEPDGRFSWLAGTDLKKGTYRLDPPAAPTRITLKSPALPGDYSTRFEFITDAALLLKGGNRDLILFKKG